MDFKPEFIQVGYAIHNNTSSPIKVLWDKAYMVIQTDACNVIPSTITLKEKAKSPDPLVLAAGQKDEGVITPVVIF